MYYCPDCRDISTDIKYLDASIVRKNVGCIVAFLIWAHFNSL